MTVTFHSNAAITGQGTLSVDIGLGWRDVVYAADLSNAMLKLASARQKHMEFLSKQIEMERKREQDYIEVQTLLEKKINELSSDPNKKALLGDEINKFLNSRNPEIGGRKWSIIYKEVQDENEKNAQDNFNRKLKAWQKDWNSYEIALKRACWGGVSPHAVHPGPPPERENVVVEPVKFDLGFVTQAKAALENNRGHSADNVSKFQTQLSSSMQRLTTFLDSHKQLIDFQIKILNRCFQ